MELSEIKDSNDLVSFLKGKGLNHNNYYHYTNLDSAINIIRNKKWHLSLGDKMNDKQELSKGDRQKWRNIFISSFAFGDGENMAMWGLYCLPWQESVRIMIPRRAMQQWMKSDLTISKVISLNNCYTYETLPLNSFRVSLTDVAYISGYRGKNGCKISWNDNNIDLDNRPDLANISDCSEITGFLKNAAWSYENETRIRIEMPNANHIEKIAIDIPEYVIDSLTIMAGPWFNGDIAKVIKDKLQRAINTKISSFKDLVFYTNICDMCKHERFSRK